MTHSGIVIVVCHSAHESSCPHFLELVGDQEGSVDEPSKVAKLLSIQVTQIHTLDLALEMEAVPTPSELSADHIKDADCGAPRFHQLEG